jgi:hypothetical protein
MAVRDEASKKEAGRDKPARAGRTETKRILDEPRAFL